MMNQLQDLKVAVQSHPAQRQQADLRLEKSKYPVILIPGSYNFVKVTFLEFQFSYDTTQMVHVLSVCT